MSSPYWRIWSSCFQKNLSSLYLWCLHTEHVWTCLSWVITFVSASETCMDTFIRPLVCFLADSTSAATLLPLPSSYFSSWHRGDREKNPRTHSGLRSLQTRSFSEYTFPVTHSPPSKNLAFESYGILTSYRFNLLDQVLSFLFLKEMYFALDCSYTPPPTLKLGPSEVFPFW